MASMSPFALLDLKNPREDEWDVVIKVKYVDALRRFKFHVQQQLITEYDMNKLRAKIASLFNFNPDALLVLTYTDEDGDIVVLENNDEFHDAVIQQKLNPLRINVELKSNSDENSASRPKVVNITDGNSESSPEVLSSNGSSVSGSEMPNRDGNKISQLANINNIVKEALKPVPEPIRGILTNVSHDVIQTASTAPFFTEILERFPKLVSSNVSQFSHDSSQRASDISNVSSPCVADINANNKPDISNDQKNPLSENIKRTPDGVDVKQSMGSSRSVAFDVNHDKSEQKEASDTLHGEKSTSAAEGSSMSPANQAGNCNFSTFPYFPQMLANDVSNMWPARFFPLASFTSQTGSASHSDARENTQCYGRHYGHRDRMSRTFHRGVTCDGCGMHPIIGPRYKSNVKENYDLCGTCFRDMGNATEYTRIDWSGFRFPKLMKEHCKHHYRSRHPSTCAFNNTTKTPRAKLESCYIQDVTVLDGTIMAPCTHFTKIWRMRNNGTLAWPFGTQLVWVRGDQFGDRCSADLEVDVIPNKMQIPVEGLAVGKELDIAVDLVAPSKPGHYISYWQMKSPFGQVFGELVWVIIQVDFPPPASAEGAHSQLNLNLPPESNSQIAPVIYDVVGEPSDQIPAMPNSENLVDELVKPDASDNLNWADFHTTAAPPSTSNIPASSSSSMDSPVPLIDIQASPPISYPTIDIPPPSILLPIPLHPASSLNEDNQVESAFLKELEEMGFKQTDLNKEVLRQNKYNLEQSVEDLCGFAEWDPLLEELQEMVTPLSLSLSGFGDRVLNRKLLEKNGGSIKRAVLDLIAGTKGD
ncbi:hypothetical protein AXF42_Ash018270 [Apostasia shenzhenica]|uniref:Uncharacterized protein n=1 Tax=Apostasia shenzhenica TaxID=1088818 RepID=A0A2I0B2M9_9ASPA|nr:hypothetical protein AXF42_Ash018270 [Apostasia shenzhenica]